MLSTKQIQKQKQKQLKQNPELETENNKTVRLNKDHVLIALLCSALFCE